jgi:hypothetical protein
MNGKTRPTAHGGSANSETKEFHLHLPFASTHGIRTHSFVSQSSKCAIGHFLSNCQNHPSTLANVPRSRLQSPEGPRRRLYAQRTRPATQKASRRFRKWARKSASRCKVSTRHRWGPGNNECHVVRRDIVLLRRGSARTTPALITDFDIIAGVCAHVPR